LGAGGVGEPLLPLLGGPAALTDQQQPHVGVIERPQEVGGAGHLQARSQCPLGLQGLDDHALVVVEVGLDQAPERIGVGVDRRGGPQDLQHAPDALLDHAGVVGVAPQLPFGVGLVDDLPVPGPLGNCRLILVAFGVRRGQCSAGHARAATRHPRPFALDDPDRLAGVAVTEVPVPLRDASFDAWWTRTSALAGPLAKRLALLPETARRQLRARLQVAVQPYQTPTGLDLPGVSLLAAAHRTWRHQG
jgi:hypothetical protein